MEAVHAALVERLPDTGNEPFGWVIHKPQTGDHVLLTCDVAEFWQTMPASAVRSAIAQRLTTWATALTPDFGVVAWGRNDQPEVLVIAADQATADIEAKIVGAYLAELNPPPPQSTAPPECGCPEFGWHLITCPHSGEPLTVSTEES